MTQVVAPPARRLPVPRWLDARLVVGVLIVVASVLVGARVVAGADDTVPVWAARTPLAPGVAVTADDLEQRQVRLDDLDAYVGGALPAGWVVTRPVGAGELLPRRALVQPAAAGERRVVTLPVQSGHLPHGLAAGQRVDVYLTPGTRTSGAAAGSTASGGATPAPPTRVLADALVASVDDGRSGLTGTGSGIGVGLSVAPDDVPALVTAAQGGAIDLVGVPDGAP